MEAEEGGEESTPRTKNWEDVCPAEEEQRYVCEISYAFLMTF